MATTPNSSEARRRIRDNPLFTSSPLDLLGANMRRSLELEFDDCSDDDGKENVSSLANRIISSEGKKKAKRFELGWTGQFEQGTTTQSLSLSDSSSESSAGEAFAYDPRQNLRTARPVFLRYRPDWRLELLSSFEGQESDHKRDQDQEVSSSREADQETKEAEAALGAHQQETKAEQESETVLGADQETPETVLGADQEKAETVLGADQEKAENVLGADQEKAETVLGADQEKAETVLGADQEKAETVLEAEQEAETVLEVEQEETEALETVLAEALETVLEAEVSEQQEQAQAGLEEASGEELAEQPGFTYSKACVALVGIFLIAALVAAAATAPSFISELVWGGSGISSYPVVDPGLVFQAAGPSYPSSADVFDWEWFGEYDTAAYGSVLQEEISLPMTNSDELNALLRTIMTGTEAEIQEKYLEFMEFDEDTGSVLVEDLRGDTGPPKLEYTDENSLEESMVVQDDSQVAAAAAAAEVEAEEIFQEEHEVCPAAENTSFPATEATRSMNRLPSTSEVSIFVLVLMVARALLTYCKKKKKRGSLTTYRPVKQDSNVVSSTETTTTAAITPTPTIRPAVKAKFDEDVVFEPASERTPYGSITGYKRLVLNEGAENERVTLTPVRRSSRIRKHLTQSPPVARRRL